MKNSVMFQNKLFPITTLDRLMALNRSFVDLHFFQDVQVID